MNLISLTNLVRVRLNQSIRNFIQSKLWLILSEIFQSWFKIFWTKLFLWFLPKAISISKQEYNRNVLLRAIIIQIEANISSHGHFRILEEKKILFRRRGIKLPREELLAGISEKIHGDLLFSQAFKRICTHSQWK